MVGEHTLNLTDASFDEEVVKSDVPVLVHFWAPWLAQCTAMIPIVDALALQYKGKIKFGRLNTEQNPVTWQRLRVVPTTFVFFDHGRIVDQRVGAMPRASMQKMIEARARSGTGIRAILRTDIPENRTLLGFGLAMVIIIGIAIFFSLWIEHAFKAMTPAQHLAAARKALGESDFNAGLRHVNAIAPSAPEAAEAVAMRQDLYNAQEIARNVEESKRQQESARVSAVQQLRERLRDLGYNVLVARSQETPDEIIISSTDFGDTDHRVRFLAFIRARNSPAIGVCAAGFQFIRLQSRSLVPVMGFDESYPLDCFKLY